MTQSFSLDKNFLTVLEQKPLSYALCILSHFNPPRKLKKVNTIPVVQRGTGAPLLQSLKQDFHMPEKSKRLYPNRKGQTECP
jgi:hypothetical protein